MLTSLPNLLTLSRILAIPGLVALLFFDAPLYRWLACGLFVLAAVTDYFDGYFARTMGQISAFGRFLDPIADKLFVAAALLMLVHAERVSELSVLAVLVILCREILVSGLREFLAGTAISLPVTWLAKWKTGLQMVAIAVLIVGDAGNGVLNPLLKLTRLERQRQDHPADQPDSAAGAHRHHGFHGEARASRLRCGPARQGFLPAPRGRRD